MEYLRVCTHPSWCDQWYCRAPNLATLLRCFQIDRRDPVPVKPVSVYWARNYEEELQNVAALFQKSPKQAARQFGIRITRDDCREVGIAIDPGAGETGVAIVDSRHANLKGDLAGFTKLSTLITRKIWEGEERICMFAPHAILGEVAILSRLESGIDKEAVARCEKTLSKRENNCIRFPAGQQVVELFSKMQNEEIPIVAQRCLVRQLVDHAERPIVPNSPRQFWLTRVIIRILGRSS